MWKRLYASVLLVLALAGTAQAEPAATRIISVTPTVDTGNIYTTGDNVGGLLTFEGLLKPTAGGGIPLSAVITDLDQQAADFHLVIFSGNPSSTTFTDQAELDINDADLIKVACILEVTSHAGFADNGVTYEHGTNCVLKTSPISGTVYAALVVRDAPTYTEATALTVRLAALQD